MPCLDCARLGAAHAPALHGREREFAVSSRKQQREYARRRYEKWLAHQSEVKERQRRRRIIVGWVLGALAATALVWLVVGLLRGDDTRLLRKPQQPSSHRPRRPSPRHRSPTPEPRTRLSPRGVHGPPCCTPRPATSPWSSTALPLRRLLPRSSRSHGEEFFAATTCHRLTTANIFVLQCGYPTGDGTGGPDYRFGPVENAPADDLYPAGTVAMARVGGDGYSMGSQFFLVYADSTIPADSAGGYTVLGQVTDGMDVLQAVADAGVAPNTAETPALEVTIQGVDVQ